MLSSSQIQSMRQGGRKLAAIRQGLIAAVKPGMSLADLDHLADQLISQSGGQSAFKRVPGYSYSTCINVNAGIVHGIPHPHISINSGDLVTVDVGLYFQNLFTDAAETIVVGTPTPAQTKLLTTGRLALKTAISQARPGHRVGHISAALEQVLTSAGYTPIRSLTGHGVGQELHQAPAIPGFLDRPIEDTPPLVPGMTLAIEAIYSAGTYQTRKLQDGWTIVTADGSDAAVFEDTILVTRGQPEVLTRFAARKAKLHPASISGIIASN